MSGRGKGKTAKKSVSQSSKAGLQFPVGRVAVRPLLIALSISKLLGVIYDSRTPHDVCVAPLLSPVHTHYVLT
jgi:hypothetical protein